MLDCLDKICDFVSGNSWKSELFSDSGMPIIRINNLNENNNDFVYWPDLKYDEKYLISNGDILVSLSGTIKAYIWRGKEALLNQRIVKISLKNEFIDSFNAKWIFYKIKESLSQIEERGNKSTIKNISISKLKEIKLSDIPSLEEQNRIITILDRVESILRKREQNVLNYNRLIKSLFLEKFSAEIKDINKYIKFSEAFSKVDTGWSPVCQNYARLDDNEIAVLKQSSVSKRFFESAENKVLPENTIIKKQCFVEKDDLLFSRKNTLEYVGSAAFIFDDVNNLLMPDTIFNLRYRKDEVSGVYLYYLFNDLNYRGNIRELATGALVSMSNISKQKLFELKLPLPDFTKQQQFEKEVRFIIDKIKNQNKSYNYLENLLKSLTQRLFSGQSIVDIESELEAIINAINLHLSDGENNIDIIKNDLAFRQKLIDRLASQEFSDINQYDKAKYIAFRLLKEKSDKIVQEFDSIKNKIILS